MSTLRLELGLPGHPFEHSYKTFQQCTTPIYLHRSWEFCNENGFVVKDNQTQLLPRRERYQFLMQAFADNGYKTKELRLLNLCQMWVQATTHADITTGNGLYLRSQQTNREYTKHTLNNKEWPKGGTPDKHSCTLWEAALNKCFVRAHDTYKKLRDPLGRWTNLPKQWKWFFDPGLNIFLKKKRTTHGDTGHGTQAITQQDNKDIEEITTPQTKYQAQENRRRSQATPLNARKAHQHRHRNPANQTPTGGMKSPKHQKTLDQSCKDSLKAQHSGSQTDPSRTTQDPPHSHYCQALRQKQDSS
jgi:hypothetical protein